MEHSNQPLMLLLVSLLPMVVAIQYRAVPIPNREHRLYRANGALVHMMPTPITARTRSLANGSFRASGKSMTLEQIAAANVAYKPTTDEFKYYYLSPENHHPKCSQIILPSVWNNQICQLPPQCGIIVQETIADGWFTSEVACLAMFTSQLPNATTTEFAIQHDADWAVPYEIVLPKTIRNKLTVYIMEDMVMFKYLDGSFQVVSKNLLRMTARYDTETLAYLPISHSQQGKFVCYHVPTPTSNLYFARQASPNLALAATQLMLDNSSSCPVSLIWTGELGQTCTVGYSNKGDCQFDCKQDLIYSCDTTIDNFSPPGYLHSIVIGTCMWIWDLLSHSVIFVYKNIIAAIFTLWAKLNIYLLLNEYLIALLLFTIMFRNIYAGIAAITLLITIFGIHRY